MPQELQYSASGVLERLFLPKRVGVIQGAAAQALLLIGAQGHRPAEGAAQVTQRVRLGSGGHGVRQPGQG